MNYKIKRYQLMLKRPWELLGRIFFVKGVKSLEMDCQLNPGTSEYYLFLIQNIRLKLVTLPKIPWPLFIFYLPISPIHISFNLFRLCIANQIAKSYLNEIELMKFHSNKE